MIPHVIRYAENRYISRLLRFFPERVFQEVHAWPEPSFAWTDKRMAFFLSFDCDMPDDAEATIGILALLDKYKIAASFALVGKLVELSPEPYRLIVGAGHEVLNHGYSKHTDKDAEGKSYGSMYYNDLSWERIEEEIIRSHECLNSVLGVRTIGFRTPHFGTFQQSWQVAQLYRLLHKNGYCYSSSVLMFYAKQRGYLQKERPVLEFPLTSMVGTPLSVFDSWSMLKAPNRRWRPSDFFLQFKKMIDTGLNSSKPVLMNVYFDPSHVAGFPGFEECLAYLISHRNEVWIGRYSDALA